MGFGFLTRKRPVSVGEISSVFCEAAAASGGTVSDAYENKKHLYIRSILPVAGDVLPEDRLQGGVALKASGTDVWVHPYIFREICANGLIIARAVAGEYIRVPELRKKDDERRAEFVCSLRQAINGCSKRNIFYYALERMVGASSMKVDRDLRILSMLNRMPLTRRRRAANTIMRRYREDGSGTRYAMTNAITSVARDSIDPELKWQLEILGGEIGVLGVLMAQRAHIAA